MTDRELLELAAKAAGIRIDKSETNGGGVGNDGFCVTGDAMLDWHNNIRWNPLTTDGDNRRLQVALKVGLVPIEDGGWACITWDHDDQVTLAADLDPNRAVVRAAAEIGKAMQQEHRRTTP